MALQLVTIEGNIGTGKTTIASHVAKYMPAMKFFAAPEPEDNPHYAAFLASPHEHALALQSWFLRERCRVYLAAVHHIEATRESACWRGGPHRPGDPGRSQVVSTAASRASAEDSGGLA